MSIRRTFVSLLLTISLVAASSASANQICAVLYEHADFGGASLVISDANAYNGWIGNWWNDKVSSLTVEPGCYITLYQHANFGGASYAIYNNTSWIGDMWNDQASSYSCSCN